MVLVRLKPQQPQEGGNPEGEPRPTNSCSSTAGHSQLENSSVGGVKLRVPLRDGDSTSLQTRAGRKRHKSLLLCQNWTKTVAADSPTEQGGSTEAARAPCPVATSQALESRRPRVNPSPAPDRHVTAGHSLASGAQLAGLKNLSYANPTSQVSVRLVRSLEPSFPRPRWPRELSCGSLSAQVAAELRAELGSVDTEGLWREA